MLEDLLFRQPPLDGPPNVLVFGEPEEAGSGAAYALGSIPLPSFMVSGAALVKRPPSVLASGGIPLPAFMVRGAAKYSSAVSRPLMGKVSAGWQVARQIEGGALARHQNATTAHATNLARWQKAAPLAGGVAVTWQDAQRARASAALRYQAARQLEAATSVRHQEATRARVGGSVRWQAAVQLATRPVGVRHQEANRMRREVAARWQQAAGGRGWARERSRQPRLSNATTRGPWPRPAAMRPTTFANWRTSARSRRRRRRPTREIPRPLGRKPLKRS